MSLRQLLNTDAVRYVCGGGGSHMLKGLYFVLYFGIALYAI